MKKIIFSVLQYLYKQKVVKRVSDYTEPLKVNGYSTVTDKTILGKNVNFNGMKIGGCGKVTIGDNFHSGRECLMITQNHNYNGKKIPYDSTYICKDIEIEDNVWIGDRVIILGGGDNRRRNNYTSRKCCSE